MAGRTGRPQAPQEQEAGREKRRRQREHPIYIIVGKQGRLPLHYLINHREALCLLRQQAIHEMEMRRARHQRSGLIRAPCIKGREVLSEIGLMDLFLAVQHVRDQRNSDRRASVTHHIIEARRVTHPLPGHTS
jgi:hypothetical protein